MAPKVKKKLGVKFMTAFKFRVIKIKFIIAKYDWLVVDCKE